MDEGANAVADRDHVLEMVTVRREIPHASARHWHSASIQSTCGALTVYKPQREFERTPNVARSGELGAR